MATKHLGPTLVGRRSQQHDLTPDLTTQRFDRTTGIGPYLDRDVNTADLEIASDPDPPDRHCCHLLDSGCEWFELSGKDHSTRLATKHVAQVSDHCQRCFIG